MERLAGVVERLVSCLGVVVIGGRSSEGFIGGVAAGGVALSVAARGGGGTGGVAAGGVVAGGEAVGLSEMRVTEECAESSCLLSFLGGPPLPLLSPPSSSMYDIARLAFLLTLSVDWLEVVGFKGEVPVIFSLRRGEDRVPLGGVALLGVFLVVGVALVLVGVSLVGAALDGVALVGVALEGVAGCCLNGDLEGTGTFSIINFSFFTGPWRDICI